MSYPGNTALAQETKDRLLRTFTQTLDLAARGGVQEALLGCDFILRLDPLFQPARELHERLSRATGTVDVEDLRAVLGDGPLAPPPTTYGTVQMPAVRPPEPARPAVDPAAVRAAMQRAYDERDFAGVVALATQQQSLVSGTPELQHLAEDAQAHVEAEPYIRRFLDGARSAIEGGQETEAERLLQKAATLDPTHPEIAELQQLAASSLKEEAPLSLEDLPQDFEFGGSANELSFADLDSAPSIGDLSAHAPTIGDLSAHAPAPAGLSSDAMPSLDFGDESPIAAAPKLSESDARIQELLDEGDASLQRGEYQAAIDAWSRIFLIDIDHAEAAKRIEQARKLKAEAERQTEELFHEGVALFEGANPTAAREIFERVLVQQPSHLAAREMLEQIESGKVRAAARPAGSGARPAPGATAAAVLKEEILVPPEPGSAPAKAPKKAAAPPTAGVKRSGRGKLLLVGGVVLVLAAGGGWYLMTHRDRLFPNSQPPAPPAAQQDAIARATTLHEQGKTTVAIAQLRRVPAGDPLYEKAQALITQWQAADQQQQQPAQTAAPETTAAGPSGRDTLLDAARAAYAEHSFLKASKLLEQAAALAPLEGTAAELLADARKQVAPMQNELAFFKQGEYEIALRGLWRLHEADRANRDVLQLMVDSYYNLGVKALQREAPSDAVESFKEALNLDSKDDGLQRAARFAATYVSRSQDLQYKIYVKYLTTRS